MISWRLLGGISCIRTPPGLDSGPGAHWAKLLASTGPSQGHNWVICWPQLGPIGQNLELDHLLASTGPSQGHMKELNLEPQDSLCRGGKTTSLLISLLLYPIVNGQVWSFMEFQCVHWISMTFHGIPWNTIDLHGIRWNFINFHGIEWNSV